MNRRWVRGRVQVQVAALGWPRTTFGWHWHLSLRTPVRHWHVSLGKVTWRVAVRRKGRPPWPRIT